MKKIGIYLITNNINGKKYVGQSRNLIKRFGQHKSESRKDRPGIIVDRAIKKYGIDNFSFEILFECPLDMLDDWETDMIRLYDSMIPRGYNCVDKCRGISEKAVEKLRNRMKENNPMKNPEVADRVRNKLKGVNHSRVTEYQIEVTKKRMKENNPMKNPDVVRKVLATKKERQEEIITKEYIMTHSKWKNIYQFNKDGRFIRKWDLISDIEKELHINHWGIYACLNGQLKTSGGYIWRCI